jgi:hypothetical protein
LGVGARRLGRRGGVSPRAVVELAAHLGELLVEPVARLGLQGGVGG